MLLNVKIPSLSDSAVKIAFVSVNFVSLLRKSPLDLGNLLGGWNPAELLEHLDKDQILILVLLVMLYKEGGDKKLMMALAYLLT